jgi:hypothetical protein
VHAGRAPERTHSTKCASSAAYASPKTSTNQFIRGCVDPDDEWCTAALLEAGPSRLRPMVMTTLSVMAALLPIATGLEEGSELLQSVALVLIGGLLTSTLLTLVFVPAMYTVFDDIQLLVQRLFRWRPRSSDTEVPAHEVLAEPAV